MSTNKYTHIVVAIAIDISQGACTNAYVTLRPSAAQLIIGNRARFSASKIDAKHASCPSTSNITIVSQIVFTVIIDISQRD